MAEPKILSDVRNLKSLTNTAGTNISNLSQSIGSLQDSIFHLNARIDGIPVSPLAILSDLNLGDEFFTEESGVLVPFIIVRKDTTSIVSLRKYLMHSMQFYTNSTISNYTISTVDAYLNSTYKSMFAASSLSEISIPVMQANNTTINVSRSTFLPSVTELTGTTYVRAGAGSVSEGSQFSYALPTSRLIGYHNGAASEYFVRSMRDSGVTYIVMSNGVYTNYIASTTYRHIRPCVSFSPTTVVYKNIGSTANVLATATIA